MYFLVCFCVLFGCCHVVVVVVVVVVVAAVAGNGVFSLRCTGYVFFHRDDTRDVC